MQTSKLLARAVKALDAGEFEAAAKDLDKLIETSPKDGQKTLAWVLRGRAAQGLGNTEDGIRAFTEATNIDPDPPRPWLELGRALVLAGRYAEAVPAIERAMQHPTIAENAEAVSLAATALNETGNSVGALKAIEEGGKRNPETLEDGLVLFQKGVAQNVLGQPQEALQTLQKAELLLKEPDLGFVRLQQGLARQVLQEHSEALRLFNLALDSLPKGPARSWLWLRKAGIHLA